VSDKTQKLKKGGNMETNNTKVASNSKTDISNTANTTSANHSAPQHAKPFNLKKRKRKAPAGW
jgi:hypothetical protein